METLKPFSLFKVFGFLNLFSKRFKNPEDYSSICIIQNRGVVFAHMPRFFVFSFLNHSKEKDVIYFVRAKRKHLPQAELSQSG